MASIKVPTTFNIDVEFEIPEFYRRLLALILDMIVQVVYVIISSKAISLLFEDAGQYVLSEVLGYFIVLLPLLIYHVLLEVLMNGQSIGKKVMGVRVVNENGGRASISQFLIRWLLRLSDTWIALIIIIIISNPGVFQDGETAFVILFAMGFLVTDIILVVSSAKSQRIGDILAGTILIRTHTKASINETVFEEVADTYKPSFPSIMRLSDKDVNAVKNILVTARKKGDYQMAEAAAEKIKNYLKIETNMPAFDFLDVLMKDYNYLSTK